MQTFGNQFLARPALADDQHGTPHRRRPTGPLYRVEEGTRLADELIFPLHCQEIGIFPDTWQEKPTCGRAECEKATVFRRFEGLAHHLLNRGQQQSAIRPKEVTQMYNRSFFRSQLGQAAIASIAAMATFVLLSSQIAVTAPTPVMAAYEQVEIA